MPDPPCVCDGILRLRDFFRSFLAGSQITCIDWHDTLCAARSGEVSSAFAGGHPLHRTQGSGVPAPAERARQISVLHRLADIVSAVSCLTSDHGAAGRVLGRGTACATCPQATVSRNPSDLHCVCDSSRCEHDLWVHFHLDMRHDACTMLRVSLQFSHCPESFTQMAEQPAERTRRSINVQQSAAEHCEGQQAEALSQTPPLRARVRACVRACVRECVHACMRT